MNKISEKTILEQLWRLLLQKNHSIIIPNVHLINGESDMISITRAGYVYEWEVKTSLSDFRAEFKNKDIKHLGLNGQEYAVPRYPARYEKMYEKHPEWRPRPYKIRTPNYFSFVVSEEIFDRGEIPDYAGILIYKPTPSGRSLYLEEKRRPKIVNKEKICDEKMLVRICQKLSYRYFREYINIIGVGG
jgi:hypothetical protein